VIQSVIQPIAGDQGQQCRLLATKILIKVGDVLDIMIDDDNVLKVIMDMHIRDHPTVKNILLYVFFEMLESNQVETKLHAFNLLFNLSVHSNFISKDVETNQSNNENGRTNGRDMEDQLFYFLREMSLWLLHKDESNNSVWESAFHLLLYFIVRDGNILESR
jgi:hypothetical protein